MIIATRTIRIVIVTEIKGSNNNDFNNGHSNNSNSNNKKVTTIIDSNSNTNTDTNNNNNSSNTNTDDDDDHDDHDDHDHDRSLLSAIFSWDHVACFCRRLAWPSLLHSSCGIFRPSTAPNKGNKPACSCTL